jgi:phospholipase C
MRMTRGALVRRSIPVLAALAVAAAVLAPLQPSGAGAPEGPSSEASRLLGSTIRGNGLIAFVSKRTGNADVFTMFFDGDNQTNLTSHPASDTDPAWSPSGARIAFASTRGGTSDIWVMNADGTGLTQLTSSTDADSQPAWSPNGLRVAFTRNRAGNNDLWVMNSNGTGAAKLVKTPASETGPAWAPNGNRIAFASDATGNLDVWTVKWDGRQPVNLTKNPANDLQPAWSPDGARLAFTTNRDGNYEVYSMNADGTRAFNLSQKPAAVDGDPVWAPDRGAKLVFTSNRTGEDEIWYTRSSDGTDPFVLSKNDLGADFGASWQPLPPREPAGWPIEHVVILFWENHSFDNVLGRLCVADARCDGATTGKLSDGTTIDLPDAGDIVSLSPHSYDAHVVAINGGKMDGFDLMGEECTDPPYQCHEQYSPDQIPTLSQLARTFALSDRTFETDGVGSYGTHLTLAATWLAGFYKATHHHKDGQPPGAGVGCDSYEIGAWQGNAWDLYSAEPTCIPFENGTGPWEESAVHWTPSIMSRFAEHGRSWRIYGAPGPVNDAGYGWSLCPTFSDCLYDPDQHQHFVDRAELFADFAAGNVADLSFIIPDNDDSQHNSRSMIQGDNYMGEVMNAIMQSPEWESTAVFISYDDAGIFYDHVPPPPSHTGAFYTGIRVPLLIVSPWANPGYTDSNVATWASMLAFAERAFGIAPLSPIDAAAYDYSEAFDFTQGPLDPIVLRSHPVPPESIRYMREHPPDPNDPT